MPQKSKIIEYTVKSSCLFVKLISKHVCQTVLCKIRFKSILKIQEQDTYFEDNILKILFEDTFWKILLYYLQIVQVALRES